MVGPKSILTPHVDWAKHGLPLIYLQVASIHVMSQVSVDVVYS